MQVRFKSYGVYIMPILAIPILLKWRGRFSMVVSGLTLPIPPKKPEIRT